MNCRRETGAWSSGFLLLDKTLALNYNAFIKSHDGQE